MKVDILIIGDFRFPGGTSTAIIADVKALHAAGYRIGLLSIACKLLQGRRGFHPGIQAALADGLAVLVPPHEPVEAKLCCLHHPSVFENLPAIPLDVSCPRFVMVVHHPPQDAFGVAQYDLAKVMQITQDLFGQVMWAPVGPKVRDAFVGIANGPPLMEADWLNIIDIDDYAVGAHRKTRKQPVIGRHSRPEAVKWPEDQKTFLEAYPDSDTVRVRLLGWGHELDDVIEDRPANWEVFPFGAIAVPDFLTSLDYFSYFHSEDWIEAFGRSILEALASGLVCFLPSHFEPLFKDAAIYCEPADVLSNVQHFEADRGAYEDQSKRARDFVKTHFGPDKVVARVSALMGPGSGAVPARARQKAGVLYLTSNGIGMGHITRCLATARRLPQDVKPVIVTMSKAFGVAETQGIAVEYLPFLRSIGLHHSEWSPKMATELGMVVQYHRPNVIVLDSNVPYDPMLEVLAKFPEIWSIWQRRPMWPPSVGEDQLMHSGNFDVVLEPSELAAPVDRGLTTKRRWETLRVPSVRLLDPAEALGRNAARELIGLAPDRPAFLMQLGSGNNIDLAAVIERICKLGDPALHKNPVQIVFARWQISQTKMKLPDHVKVLDAFPISKFLNAFDGAIALAGYNTFHENIAAALPTLFMANEHPEQDEQWLRAEYAAHRGLALSARFGDTFQTDRALRKLLEPQTRDNIRTACQALELPNGAQAGADFIASLAMTRKPSHLAFDPTAAAPQ